MHCRAGITAIRGVFGLVLLACGGSGETPVAPLPPPPKVGTLTVTVSGLPTGTDGVVLLTRPSGQVDTLRRTTTLTNLPTGDYLLAPRPVVLPDATFGSTTYWDPATSQPVSVTAGNTVTVGVQYRSGESRVSVVFEGGGFVSPQGNLLLTDSLGRTRTVPMAGLTTFTVAPGTYRLTPPAVPGPGPSEQPPRPNPTPGRWRADSVSYTVVAGIGQSPTIRLTYRLASGRLTVQFPSTSLAVGARLVDSANTVVARVTPAEPTITVLDAGRYRLIGDTVDAPLARTVGSVTAVTMAAGQVSATPVTFQTTPKAGFNLAVTDVEVMQAVSSYSVPVALVADRVALARVTVLANAANLGLAPTVVLTARAPGQAERVFRLTAAAALVPQVAQPDSLSWTWNAVLPAELVRPGLTVQASLEASGVIAGDPSTDNIFPRNAPLAVDVREVPPLAITLVPIRLANGKVPTLTQLDADTLIGYIREILPVSRVTVRVREPVNSEYVLANPNMATQIQEVRTRDGRASTEIYAGLVEEFGNGWANLRGNTVALGRMEDGFTFQLAHEVGHLFGVMHAPFCGAVGIEAGYPYEKEPTPTRGWDSRTGRLLVTGGVTDIMGYCRPAWNTDFTWMRMLEFRIRSAFVRGLMPSSLIVR